MVVELICVGTELLLGNIVNTNAAYLSEKCALLGLSMYHQSVVGDNAERLKESLETAANRFLMCGDPFPAVWPGLEDDLTKETAAEVMGIPLKEDPHSRERIEEYFKNSQYKVITDNNWKQALVPEGAIVLDNENGMGPGHHHERRNGKSVILLQASGRADPDVEGKVYDYLNKLQPEIIYSTMVRICGLGESFVENEIRDLIDNQTNPTIATYAKIGQVDLRVTAKAASEKEAAKLAKPMLKELLKRFGDHIYTMDEHKSLEEVIVHFLKERSLTLTTAESCTGGMIAARITDARASGVFKRDLCRLFQPG